MEENHMEVTNKKKIILPVSVSEIHPKYQSLVGKHIFKYPSKPDGLCQNTSKTAILFSDPRRGKDIAEEENKYPPQNFDQFKFSYEWPHTILIGGGKKKTFKNEE